MRIPEVYVYTRRPVQKRNKYSMLQMNKQQNARVTSILILHNLAYLVIVLNSFSAKWVLANLKALIHQTFWP